MKVVIIGGVAGGASCAARLRRLNEDAEIIMLERGPYISFANCGLPYYVGKEISARENLLLQTPERFKARFNIDARVYNEALSINREEQTILVKNLETGKEYTESYDKLLIATGSSPLRPDIKGINSARVHSATTIPDIDAIVKNISNINKKPGHAIVIGGGFIGLEMCENLKHLGMEVSLVEGNYQLMHTLDAEMSAYIHKELEAHDVELYLGERVVAFNDSKNSITVKMKSGTQITGDLVILAIGVRPNSAIAKQAGLELGNFNGIVVNEELRTNDENIYAVGDAVEVVNTISEVPCLIPLAGPANKQGRMAADNIAGNNKLYYGSQGTSIIRIFDLDVASTGLNTQTLISYGLQYGIDFKTALIVQKSHAGYFPGATPVTIKIIYSKNECILGAQVVGKEGVDKHIDILSTVIHFGGTLCDLCDLELSYAPPFSSAKAPVNMAGFTMENIEDGIVRFCEFDSCDTEFWEEDSEYDPYCSAVLLDVRETQEFVNFAVPGSINLPLGQIRNLSNEELFELFEIDNFNEPIIIFCATGPRAHTASRILLQRGFTNVMVYPGGTYHYRATHTWE